VSAARSSRRPFILSALIDEALQAVSHKIVVRPTTHYSRQGALVENQGSTCMADNDADPDGGCARRPLQAPPPDMGIGASSAADRQLLGSVSPSSKGGSGSRRAAQTGSRKLTPTPPISRRRP
jgi:hypothetical protein